MKKFLALSIFCLLSSCAFADVVHLTARVSEFKVVKVDGVEACENLKVERLVLQDFDYEGDYEEQTEVEFEIVKEGGFERIRCTKKNGQNCNQVFLVPNDGSDWWRLGVLYVLHCQDFGNPHSGVAFTFKDADGTKKNFLYYVDYFETALSKLSWFYSQVFPRKSFVGNI